MASGNHQILVLPLCVLALQGCGNSSETDPSNRDPITVDDQSGVSEDGESLQAGDGTLPPDVVNLPGNDPETSVVIGPEGDSSLIVNERIFPLDAALGDVWGAQGEHFNVNLTLTDGKFTIMPTTVDEEIYNLLVPAEATAIVYAEMFSPGDHFSFVTYSYSPLGVDGGMLAGNALFTDAYVGFDIDRSGEVDDDEELSIVGGTIEFTGIVPDIEVHFSVTLENGLLAQGHYTGLFDFTNRY